MSIVAGDSTIGVYELKTHLSAVLEEVIAGREVTITRHGHPVARLSPAVTPTREMRRQAIEEIRSIAKSAQPFPVGVTIESLYREGRV